MQKSVKACAEQRWHLHLWDPANPADHGRRFPWFCRSWRHEGDCRLWKGAQDFQRVKQALAGKSTWTYLVLSLPQATYRNQWSMFRGGLFLWAKLRKRITREYGPFEYIQTWERHQKGGPHVNIVIESQVFQDQCYTRGREYRHDWLGNHAEQVGFGWWYAVRPMYNRAGLAWYLTKLDAELIGAGQKNQVPVNAPPHFRRLRASRGTLPPVMRGELTGTMVFQPIKCYTPRKGGYCEAHSGEKPLDVSGLEEIPNDTSGIKLTTQGENGRKVGKRKGVVK